MAGITEKTRGNKKRWDKEYLQWVRLFADLPVSGEKCSESVRKKGGAARGECGISTITRRSEQGNQFAHQFQKGCA
jgi:hypothetical protein